MDKMDNTPIPRRLCKKRKYGLWIRNTNYIRSKKRKKKKKKKEEKQERRVEDEGEEEKRKVFPSFEGRKLYNLEFYIQPNYYPILID